MTACCSGVGPKLPKQSAVMATIIGGLGGFMLAYQQSSGNLGNSPRLCYRTATTANECCDAQGALWDSSPMTRRLRLALPTSDSHMS